MEKNTRNAPIFADIFSYTVIPRYEPAFSPVDSPATIPTISWKPTDESERTGQRARGNERVRHEVAVGYERENHVRKPL